jgi:mRNA interferase RelE/StbE
MQVLFTNQFLKQIRKVKDKHLAKRIESAILDVKNATELSGISQLKDLKGYNNVYRIRIGDCRIGLHVRGNVVEFACFMDRSEIYRYLP